jgi:hypothetical protein
MEGGMMRQVDEMDEDMAGMDEYGVSISFISTYPQVLFISPNTKISNLRLLGAGITAKN